MDRTNQSSNGIVPDKYGLTHLQIARPGKVFSIFVEGDGHYSVSGIKRLLHTVAMVNINVDIQHPLMISAKIPGILSIIERLSSFRGKKVLPLYTVELL